jgi:hypothetical protein
VNCASSSRVGSFNRGRVLIDLTRPTKQREPA